MEVTVNGTVRSLPADCTVNDMLIEVGMDPSRVAVEIGMEIVPRKSFADRILKQGENIEIVSFVGGG